MTELIEVGGKTVPVIAYEFTVLTDDEGIQQYKMIDDMDPRGRYVSGEIEGVEPLVRASDLRE